MSSNPAIEVGEAQYSARSFDPVRLAACIAAIEVTFPDARLSVKRPFDEKTGEEARSLLREKWDGLRTFVLRFSEEIVNVTLRSPWVLHLEFPHLGARPPSLLEQIANAKKLVRRLKNVEDTFRTRINNALDNMARLRTSDKLKDLRKHGVISKQMIDAWQSLRNASTHATIDPKVFNNERLWHDGYTVAMMLHLILFTAIGYSGRYMDFSVTGWPEKEFLTPTLDSVNAETSTNVEAASPTDDAANKGNS